MKPDTAWYNDDLRDAKEEGVNVHGRIPSWNFRCICFVNNASWRMTFCYMLRLLSIPKKSGPLENTLLNRNNNTKLPTHESESAKRFVTFFAEKMSRIRSDLFNNTVPQLDHVLDNNSCCTCELSSFSLPRTEEIKKTIIDAPPKSCYLDQAPAWLLRELIDELLPILSCIIVQSLQSSVAPDQYKTGHISSLIKKTGVNTELMQHYRSVSNLAFVSKVIERVVAKQLSEHLKKNNLHEQFQSAYRQHPSTETALIKVHIDILSAVDRGCFVVLNT